MPWVPMTSAGANPDIWLGQEASRDGSTIYGNAGVEMSGSDWEIEGPWPEDLQQFRVRVISYEQGGVGSPGNFIHRATGGEFISTPVGGAGFVFELSRSETFAGNAVFGFSNSGWDSEVYASDGYEMVIEVFVDAEQLNAADDYDEVNIGESTTTPVLANDTIDDGDGERPVTLADLAGLPVIVREPEHGTATVNSDGTITYTPNPGTEATEDSYEYEILEHGDEGDCVELNVDPWYITMAEFTEAFGDIEPTNPVFIVDGDEYAYMTDGDGYSPSSDPIPYGLDRHYAEMMATVESSPVCVFLSTVTDDL